MLFENTFSYIKHLGSLTYLYIFVYNDISCRSTWFNKCIYLFLKTQRQVDPIFP